MTAVPATATPAPAGWYADPSGSPAHRYWDGAAWTAHVAPRPVAPVPHASAPAPVTHAPARAVGSVVTTELVADRAPAREAKASIGLGIAIAVGSILPWVTVAGQSVTLADLSGTPVMLLMAAGGFLAWFGYDAMTSGRVRNSGFACAAVVIAVMVAGVNMPDEEMGEGLIAVEPGIGAVMSLFAALASIWTLTVLWRHQSKMAKIDAAHPVAHATA